MKFRDIPEFPSAHYSVHIPVASLQRHVNNEIEYGLNLNPDFQRGHVWTQEQRIRYVEYILRGGEGGRILCFNNPKWNTLKAEEGPYEILDGLQRLTSLLMFLRSEIPAFGTLYKDFEDRLHSLNSIIWTVYRLPDRPSILQYYLDMNAGGTPHAESEIERVRKMLQESRTK